ncbi:MAG: hypothetical protein ABSF03_18625 [Streptosporangiaceae bacterium]
MARIDMQAQAQVFAAQARDRQMQRDIHQQTQIMQQQANQARMNQYQVPQQSYQGNSGDGEGGVILIMALVGIITWIINSIRGARQAQALPAAPSSHAAFGATPAALPQSTQPNTYVADGLIRAWADQRGYHFDGDVPASIAAEYYASPHSQSEMNIVNLAAAHANGQIPASISSVLRGTVLDDGSTITGANAVDGTIRVAGEEVWANVNLTCSNGATGLFSFHACGDNYEWKPLAS